MEHLQRSVGSQEGDPLSILSFYRRMIAFRRQYPALLKGAFRMVGSTHEYVSFVRILDGREIFCAFNLSETDQTADLPDGTWRALPGTGFASSIEDNGAYLPAWQALFAEKVEQ